MTKSLGDLCVLARENPASNESWWGRHSYDGCYQHLVAAVLIAAIHLQYQVQILSAEMSGAAGAEVVDLLLEQLQITFR